MDYLELFFGQLPEAIFFPLFVILCKNEKVLSKKGIAFIGLSIFQYLSLKYFFPFNSWFQFIYLTMLYFDCSFLWKNKNLILDLMYIIIASFYIIFISIIIFFIFYNNVILAVITNRILLFLPLLFKRKINLINKIYYKYWNRDDKIKKKILSTTFRTMNVVLINFIFVIINICMIIVPLIYYSV